MMFWNGGTWSFWQVMLMWLAMIGFWAVAIWAIWTFVVATTRRPSDDQNGRSARQILDERLAHGDIDTEEYRRLRDALASPGERTPLGARRPIERMEVM
jgi:putative membrane protein